MRPADLALYYHTVRHLRPVQITARLWRRLKRPQLTPRPAPPRQPVGGNWVRPARRPPALCGPRHFQVIGQKIRLESPRIWNDQQLSHLALYNLHYFDDLNARQAAERRAWHDELLWAWLRDNATGSGVGWEPYPISIRVVNWIKWALGGATLPPEALDSLATQVDFLTQQLEYHLLANHLLANAKALVFAGVFFQGPLADRWRERGLQILDRQLDEQILPDGGHFELSPMYHSLILEDVLDLINLGRTFPDRLTAGQIDRWGQLSGPMRRWLAAMCHGDGQIAFFNDAAFQIAPEPAELERYARQLGLPPSPTLSEGVLHLPHSGYIRVQRDGMVAILDVAAVGPDYQPGHAHADTLSFECSLEDRRILVNAGVSCYGVNPQRSYERSTAAHNTVVVDQCDSSEVWGGFRVARRARPVDLQLHEEGASWKIACSHTGYRRLPGRVTHRRQWSFAERQLQLTDWLQGRYQTAAAHFHFHPEVTVQAEGPERVSLAAGTHRLTLQPATADWQFVPTEWHPAFGRSLPSTGLVAPFDGPQLFHHLRWS